MLPQAPHLVFGATGALHARPIRQRNSAGVTALFTGRSGTGKTLAPRILAAELGVERHRNDLTTTINRQVGETEKNLQEVFATAEEHDVVLLIDEGDALLS